LHAHHIRVVEISRLSGAAVSQPSRVSAPPSRAVPAAPKILFYSHDTVGLGNIRRTLLLSQTLAEEFPRAAMLLVTGSPMIHAFPVPGNLDYIKLPCLDRTDADHYEPRFLGAHSFEVDRIRRAILVETAVGFRPDLLIVDKRPAGVGGELLDALRALRRHGTAGYVRAFKTSAQYALSRTIDDSSGTFDLPADNRDFAGERGRADFDRRHRFSLAGTYEWAQDRMRLATVLTMASGAPYDVTTGSDDNHDGIVNDRPAGVTRNTGTGPWLKQVDLRLTAILRAPRPPSADPESAKREFVDNLELNLDVFNALNALNVNTRRSA
jgi:hypothetical protein